MHHLTSDAPYHYWSLEVLIMNKEAGTPILLTVKEVSQLLRIHRPKVYDLINTGIIEGFKVGSDWRIKRDSIEKIAGKIPLDFFK